jgi:hypothetical protein
MVRRDLLFAEIPEFFTGFQIYSPAQPGTGEFEKAGREGCGPKNLIPFRS